MPDDTRMPTRVFFQPVWTETGEDRTDIRLPPVHGLPHVPRVGETVVIGNPWRVRSVTWFTPLHEDDHVTVYLHVYESGETRRE